jgi:glutathione S-transferase
MERRFSPYCSGQDRVPVLRDGDQVLSDSWTIAIYLEDA